jgi:hypothetical protein
MRLRPLFASILAASLVVAGSPLRGRAAEGIVRATGRMTILASSLSYTDIRIPRDARLSLNYFIDKRLPTPVFDDGPGFGALLLYSRADLAFNMARLPASKGAFQRNVSLAADLCQLDDFCKVPAGDYVLFAVTEAPLRVELRLQGLAGRSTVELDERATGDVSEATLSYFHSSPRGGAEAAAHGAGFAPTLDRKSHYLFTAFWFKGSQEALGPPPADSPALQVGNAGSCMFSGSPPAQAFAPGCPTGTQGFNLTTARTLSDFGYIEIGSVANIGPGQYAPGNYAVHTGIHDPGFTGFWLDLEPH